jgi:hypothetical protein
MANKKVELEFEIEDGVGDEEMASVTATDTRLILAKKIISNIKEELSSLERLLISESEPADLESLVRRSLSDDGERVAPANDGRVVEGVFDGENMVGSDGRQYVVPPNYASKSKLVEGDILKLTIQPNGTFMYKQIGPIERQRIVGALSRDEMTNEWQVVASGRKYAVLTAAVSFHKGDYGDEAVILIPKAAPSKWAAVENIVKRAE